MKPPKESAIVAQIVKRLRARGDYVVKLHGGPMQRSGLPDLLVIHQGHVVFLEVKRPGEQVTAIQEHTLGELRRHGATVAVVRSADEAERVIDAAQGEPERCEVVVVQVD